MTNTDFYEMLKTKRCIYGCSITKARQIANQFIQDNQLSDTVAMQCDNGIVLVTKGKLPRGFKWQAYKGKSNRMRVVKEMELSA